MTDKQIIIDGCDVSGCKHAIPTTTTPKCGIKDWIHCDGLNCYYKQLKRKEQECEELKGCLFQVQNATISLTKQLDQLKAENETYKRMLDDTEVRVALIDVKTGERELWLKLGMKADKLKQTLTEIKEICNNNDELQGDFNLVDCDKYKLGKHNLANKILQKISECEVENE